MYKYHEFESRWVQTLYSIFKVSLQFRRVAVISSDTLLVSFPWEEENLAKYIVPSSSAAQSHAYLVLFLIAIQGLIMPWNLDGCSSTKSRGLLEGSPGWAQPTGCWRHSLWHWGSQPEGFRIPFLRDPWWLLMPELWMSACLPVACSWVTPNTGAYC